MCDVAPGLRRAPSILSGLFVAAITVTSTLACKPIFNNIDQVKDTIAKITIALSEHPG